MQSATKIQEMHEEVGRMVDTMRISKAIGIVREMLKLANLPALSAKADELSATYRYMTDYMLAGGADQGRDRIVSDIGESIRMLADMALRAERAKESPDYYYETLRFNRLRKESLNEILTEYGNISSELALIEAAGDTTDESIRLRQHRQEDLERLFNTLFTSLGAESDYADLTRYMTSGYADEAVVAQTLSAMTLGLLFYYDRGKMKALLDIYDNAGNDRIAARALTGIVIAMIPNQRRIVADPNLMARLSLWKDSDTLYNRLRRIVKDIVGTRDTERIANKMRDEVLPELMKMRPEIMKAIRESSLDPETIAENNPEWEEMLNNSTLGEKMRELSEMQGEGADLMMVTFSNLKQFPFFHKASNWFLPFDFRHTELKLSAEMARIIEIMSHAGPVVCDSDLYSLAIAANHLPAAQMQMMSSQLSANFEQLSEEARSSIESAVQTDFDTEALKAVRDLYRFFKLFRKRDGFFDPFSRPLQFQQLPVVGEMLSDDETLQLIGEFYFSRGYYSDALPLLRTLSLQRPDDATLLEKLGYCHQMEADFESALNAYVEASLLRTPGQWLVKKLAFANRCLGNYDKAAQYYLEALKKDPDNFSLIMNAGNMLVEAGDYPAAQRQFYHANYLKSNSPRAIRAIAWTELMNGHLDKAADYYNRVIALKPIASDYLNAGHVAFLSKNNREALNYYRLSASMDAAEFERAFRDDIKNLSGFEGYDRTAHLLMRDLALE